MHVTLVGNESPGKNSHPGTSPRSRAAKTRVIAPFSLENAPRQFGDVLALLTGQGERTMTAQDKVYFRFAREHYVGRPLRDPEHVEALLEAAEIAPGKVNEAFWRQLRADWVWGVSSAPFAGPDEKLNAAYRKHCIRRGVAP
jgi:hypothetical protein